MLVFINTANRHRKLTHEHEASRAKLFLATVHCSPDQGFETELPNLDIYGFGRSSAPVPFGVVYGTVPITSRTRRCPWYLVAPSHY